jgi:hypothetical protein
MVEIRHQFLENALMMKKRIDCFFYFHLNFEKKERKKKIEEEKKETG